MLTPAAVRHADCPKTMTYGPCGGVNADGTCEVAPTPCVFLGDALPVRWDGDGTGGGAPSRNTEAAAALVTGTGTGRPHPAVATTAGRDVLDILARRPLIMTGFPARAMVRDDIARTADELRGRADAVLSGDAAGSRTQYPPAYRAVLMTNAGMRAWMGINARDRNRVALEGELAALQDIGVAGVHCVTGDHTRTGDRPDAQPVFDLEGTTLLPLARAQGLATSFAESPDAPPAALRGQRVREKEQAGGMLCLTQYCGDAEHVASFIERGRQAGTVAPVLPGVPLVVDRAGAELLASFHAATLPTGYVHALFAARDVRREGIRLAIEYGRSLLAVPGVSGVVVAGGVQPGDEQAYARALATVAAELGGGSS
ncbi:methylenetetrahydrofolate reductase C-terminal domain-containing protein [Microbacterium sp. HA-8]|uniref:methylenetetrahydrofolate reductase C-terminal domain-containing protein n=1 Tax=Microbacterium sp. HA-8 TaxID=3234200 RepID=UPI0038F81A76